MALPPTSSTTARYKLSFLKECRQRCGRVLRIDCAKDHYGQENPPFSQLKHPEKKQKKEKNDKEGQEILWPDVAAKCPCPDRGSIEQSCYSASKSSIIAASKKIG